MFNVGAGEMLVILLLALIVLGPDKLPSAARQAGKYLSEFRRMSDGFQRELRDAMDLDGMKPQSGTMKPVSTTATGEATSPADASPDVEGSPAVGESHRVIESANGPTLPPVMQPTVIPDVGPTPATTDAIDAAELADGPKAAMPTADRPAAPPASPRPAATVQVDGPSASFD